MKFPILHCFIRRLFVYSHWFEWQQVYKNYSESFFGLARLKSLLLANNKLKGQLSSQMCQLSSINILDLLYNKFIGSIPSCFNNMFFGKDLVQLFGDATMAELDFYYYYYYNSHFRSNLWLGLRKKGCNLQIEQKPDVRTLVISDGLREFNSEIQQIGNTKNHRYMNASYAWCFGNARVNQNLQTEAFRCVSSDYWQPKVSD